MPRTDGLDPTTWEPREPARLYLDNRLERYALLDEIDFVWASRWRWYAKHEKRRRKLYACRNAKTGGGHADRTNFTVRLHVEIMKRKEPKPERPDGAVLIPDHVNGNSLDCRRENLVWATYSENARSARRRKK